MHHLQSNQSFNKPTLHGGGKPHLGIGLYYCIELTRLHYNSTTMSIRLQEDIHHICFFCMNPTSNGGKDNYKTELYIKSGVKVDEAYQHIKDCINNFEWGFSSTSPCCHQIIPPNLTYEFRMMRHLHNKNNKKYYHQRRQEP